MGVWQGMRCLDAVAGRQDVRGYGHRSGRDAAGDRPVPAAIGEVKSFAVSMLRRMSRVGAGDCCSNAAFQC